MSDYDWLRLDWAEFKAQVDARSISIQKVTVPGSFHLRAIDGDFKIETYIHTDGNMPTELADFNANYASAVNASPRQTVVRRLGVDTVGTDPQTLQFTATLDDKSNHDVALESSTGLVSLRGGTFEAENAQVHSDTIGVIVVDKDDVLGFGATPEAPITVGTFIRDGRWTVQTGKNELIDEGISGAMPAGLYARLIYNSTATTGPQPKGSLNMLCYEV